MSTERRYGVWAGDRRGIAEDATRCVEEVFSSGHHAGYITRQCQRARGFGKDGLYCYQHSRDTSKITPLRHNKGEKP